MDDKIIVTNRGALQAKYGTAGYREIVRAVAALTAADKARGIVTRLVAIDDKAQMKRCRGMAVTVVCDGFLLSHTLLAERIAVEP